MKLVIERGSMTMVVKHCVAFLAIAANPVNLVRMWNATLVDGL